MERVCMVADSVVSPLGNTTAENFSNLLQGISGVLPIDDAQLAPATFYGARYKQALDPNQPRFEALCHLALRDVMQQVSLPKARTVFILSTTKGNIDFLEQGRADHPRIHLHATAAHLAHSIGLDDYLVVSNACISGVMAAIVARRLLLAGRYDHAVILGADVLSRFVISGFQSLAALTAERCRPFDAARKGINLGEAAAAAVLSVKPEALGTKPRIVLGAGGLSNDANHISGPSRTGEELAQAIAQALQGSGIAAHDVDFVSAHGTATLYNDEMEAKAFNLSGLASTPLNSLKGYFGHTLGAAGVVELILSAEALRQQQLIASPGFETPGTSMPVNVIRTTGPQRLATCLKTASGFGGCNAALVIKLENNL